MACGRARSAAGFETIGLNGSPSESADTGGKRAARAPCRSGNGAIDLPPGNPVPVTPTR